MVNILNQYTETIFMCQYQNNSKTTTTDKDMHGISFHTCAKAYIQIVQGTTGSFWRHFFLFFPSLFFSERAEMAVLWPHAPEIPLLNLSDDRLVLNIFWPFAALFFHRSVAGSVPLPQNHCFQIIQPSFLSMERFVSETFSNFCVTFS